MPEFVDAHGVAIVYYEWEAPAPKGVVQIAHGVGEHVGRYAHLVDSLVAAGYSVVADDHRGHGATGMRQHGGDRSKLGRLGPGGLRATIDAVVQLSELTRAAHPGLPLIMIGHSWGSLMAQIIVNRRPTLYDAVVLTGTAYRAFGSMNGGDLNKRHAHLGTTGAEWLSRDPEISGSFYSDPLNFSADILKLFGLADALRLFGRPARGLPADLPVLIMVGDDDSLGGAASAQRLARAYRQRSGLRDVEARVYPDARHEVFNELNKDEVIADLVAWTDARVTSAASSR
ncbi:alpha/beta hydrolase [Herbiconiux sp. L3-i23]|uniref:alpha/beta hydrolase n=1 Tax=Herbiconiux sp. L3-i23 TaxID=2905871 RepID=UPI002057CFBA|nr:alpha/beta fold hydrolase [Herbiconiux sp. L3-i23]BDI21308.1 lysophospholipase [Herbiconiux sp. L3-i23]